MFPFNILGRGASDLWKAITIPFTALFVIGLTGFINWMTFNGQWWFKWVAFGMGIAVLATWARAFKTLAVFGVAALVGWWLYKRYGEAARRTFRDWFNASENRDMNAVGQALIATRQGREFDQPVERNHA